MTLLSATLLKERAGKFEVDVSVRTQPDKSATLFVASENLVVKILLTNPQDFAKLRGALDSAWNELTGGTRED